MLALPFADCSILDSFTKSYGLVLPSGKSPDHDPGEGARATLTRFVPMSIPGQFEGRRRTDGASHDLRVF